MAIYITGDTHGDFMKVKLFCEENKTNNSDIMIILGDAGINYHRDKRDKKLKLALSKLPITLFCIHGNHEVRPSNISSYKLTEFHGGKVYQQDDYPNILFAKDGEIYDFNGNKTIVIGGAYSVDKYYRLSQGYHWFEDEQPSQEIKNYVENQLESVGWEVDTVLSHTAPLKYEPTHWFLSFIDQSTVDKSTEQWMDKIESKLQYKNWYAGHYHGDGVHGRVDFMFYRILNFS